MVVRKRWGSHFILCSTSCFEQMGSLDYSPFKKQFLYLVKIRKFMSALRQERKKILKVRVHRCIADCLLIQI